MTDEPVDLHMHLGVDRLHEDLFETLFGAGVLNPETTVLQYITAETYRQTLRGPVDGATAPAPAFRDAVAGRHLLISRPRMLYPGAPLNCGTEGVPSLYKLEQIQKVFDGHRVVFHLFLTDHLSYLFDHQTYVSENSASVPAASWMPLVRAILSKVLKGNELQVWNAEELEQFFPDFLDTVLRVPAQARAEVMAFCRARGLTAYPQAQVEAFADRAGLDQDRFDHVYEDELRQLNIR